LPIIIQSNSKYSEWW